MKCRMGWSGGVALTLFLAGCQSEARQDSLLQKDGVCSVMTPLTSGVNSYHPVDVKAPDSIVAYSNMDTPVYCDRPLSETLQSTLELADYRVALQETGLFPLLQRNGPFTVFAIPNESLEALDAASGGSLRSASDLPRLKNLLAYTIVQGEWSPSRLEKAIRKSPTHQVVLSTLAGKGLIVRNDLADGQMILQGVDGSINRLWVAGIPQSNGVLYFTRSVLSPVQVVASSTH
ncbi:MAG: fasciclin [Acetobacter sp.]|nr:fasciclin [Acetobacter sp.]